MEDQLLSGNISIIGHQVTQVAFKNCAPFAQFITKIDGATIDDADEATIFNADIADVT